MNLTPVLSSDIAAIGYDPQSQVLAIRFNRGGVYYYDDVSSNVYQELMNDSSKGSYFHRNIRPFYKSRRS